MRNALLFLTPVLALLILLVGQGGNTPPAGFPDNNRIANLLRDCRPADFHEKILETMGGDALRADSIRALLRTLEEIEKKPEEPLRRESIEAYRAWLLAVHGHDRASLSIVRRLAHDQLPFSPAMHADLAMLEASLELRSGNASAATAAVDRLAKTDSGAALALRQRLDFPPASRAAGPADAAWPLAALLLVFLLALPAGIMERERKLWLKRFPDDQNRIAPYHAFKRSPLAAFLVTAGGLLVLALGLPAKFGCSRDIAFAALYWLISYTLTLVPMHRLDLEVHKGSWDLREYLSTVFRLHLLKALPLVAPLIAFFVLRHMAVILPWWVVNSPWAPGLAFAALTAAVLLLIPFLLPALMGMRRISAGLLPRMIRDLPVKFYRWPLPKIGVVNAFSFGYFKMSHSMAFTAELLDNGLQEDIVAIAAHEEAHLVDKHLLLYFLAMVDMALAAGLWASLFPLAAERLLIFGPTVMQGILLFVLWLFSNRLFTSMGRKFEFEADFFAAKRVGREPYISALTNLTHANFMPARVREGDTASDVHPSLAERKHALRSCDGIVFEPTAAPAADLVLALWRSRLALEWNRGETDAVHLCSLDDDPPDETSPLNRFKAIARRQARFGAECLLDKNGAVLEIIECAQKAVLRKADPAIPTDRVCALCSGGMRKALVPDSLTWSETPQGCRLTMQDPRNGETGGASSAPAGEPVSADI